MRNIANNLIDIALVLDKTGTSSFITATIKTALGIKDKIYLSKFQKFWNAIEEHKFSKEEFIKRVKEQEDWQKVGENFLLAIDSFSSFDKCY